MQGTYRLKPIHHVHWFRNQDGTETPIKSGETVTCDPSELSGWLHRFEIVEAPAAAPVPNLGLRMVHRGGGSYDVINDATGKQINGKRLTKREAAELVEDAPLPELEGDLDGPATGPA